MYPRYFGMDFTRAPFPGQMLPVPEQARGPPVIQFNFFGQDSNLPSLLSQLNPAVHNESDNESDFDFSKYIQSNFRGSDTDCMTNPKSVLENFSKGGPMKDQGGEVSYDRQFEQGTLRKLEMNNMCNQNGSWNPQHNYNFGKGWLDHGFDVDKEAVGLRSSVRPEHCNWRENSQEPYLPQPICSNIRKNFNPAPNSTSPYSITQAKDLRSNNSSEGATDCPHVTIGPLAGPPKPASQPSRSQKPVSKYDLTNCRYCRVAKQPYDHPLHNEEGDVVCAKLSQYKCPFCNATGTKAHTLKYCTENPITKGNLAEIKKLGKGKAPEEHRDEAFRLKKRKLKCRFCHKYGRDSNHAFKDLEGILCPIMMQQVCGLCGATGRQAHSEEKCPAAKKDDQNHNIAVTTTAHATDGAESRLVDENGNIVYSHDLLARETVILEVRTLTESKNIHQKSFGDLPNSSAILSSTMCAVDDKQNSEPFAEDSDTKSIEEQNISEESLQKINCSVDPKHDHVLPRCPQETADTGPHSSAPMGEDGPDGEETAVEGLDAEEVLVRGLKSIVKELDAEEADVNNNNNNSSVEAVVKGSDDEANNMYLMMDNMVVKGFNAEVTRVKGEASPESAVKLVSESSSLCEKGSDGSSQPVYGGSVESVWSDNRSALEDPKRLYTLFSFPGKAQSSKDLLMNIDFANGVSSIFRVDTPSESILIEPFSEQIRSFHSTFPPETGRRLDRVTLLGSEIVGRSENSL